MSSPRALAWTLSFALGLAPTLTFTMSEADAATPVEQREAEDAWQKGRRLAAQRRWADAVAAYREADTLDAKPQYKLDLARALLSAGSPSEANDVLDELDAIPGLQTATRGAAAALRERVEGQLATIVVEVTGPKEGLTLHVDDRRVDPGEVVRVGPGEHVVEAKADGYRTATRTVSLRARQTEAVSLKLERIGGPAPGTEDFETSAPEAPTEEPISDGGGTLLPAAIAWGVGGVCLGLGAMFGQMAFDEYAKAEVGCDDGVCPEENVPALDASRYNGNASTALFIAGGVSVAAGVVLAVVFGFDDEPQTHASGPTVRPLVGDQLGVTGRF